MRRQLIWVSTSCKVESSKLLDPVSTRRFPNIDLVNQNALSLWLCPLKPAYIIMLRRHTHYCSYRFSRLQILLMYCAEQFSIHSLLVLLFRPWHAGG